MQNEELPDNFGDFSPLEDEPEDTYETEYDQIYNICREYKRLSISAYNLDERDIKRYYGLWFSILQWGKDNDEVESFQEFFSKDCPVVDKHDDVEIAAVCNECQKSFVESEKGWNCDIQGTVYRDVGKFRMRCNRKHAWKYASYIQKEISELRDQKITAPEVEESRKKK